MSSTCRLVYDFDTGYPFATSAEEYITKSFKIDERLLPDYEQRFRVIPADDFISHFASDRSHMDISKVEFPSYAPLRGSSASTAMNLDTYIDVSTLGDSDMEPHMGIVYNRSGFARWVRD